MERQHAQWLRALIWESADYVIVQIVSLLLSSSITHMTSCITFTNLTSTIYSAFTNRCAMVFPSLEMSPSSFS